MVKTSDAFQLQWPWPTASWRRPSSGAGSHRRKPSGRTGRQHVTSKFASYRETTATIVQNALESPGPPALEDKHNHFTQSRKVRKGRRGKNGLAVYLPLRLGVLA